MNLKLKKRPKVLVVAHDAGGAEVIAAYIKKYSGQFEFLPYVAGLAARICKRDGIPFKRAPRTRVGMAHVMKKHQDAAYALIGTGWMTKIEANACTEAKLQGIKACMYLDSWMKYRSRFGYPKYGWQENLPDEFWVGDSYAFDLAKRTFRDVRVRLVPNQYFVNIRKRYKSIPSSVRESEELLFLSTPDTEAGKIFSELLNRLSRLENPTRVLVRLHPADERGRYSALKKFFHKKVRIEISREKDIVRDLIRARFAIGPETMGLAVAAMVGIQAVCVASRDKKPVLPFPHMFRATNVQAAIRILRL